MAEKYKYRDGDTIEYTKDGEKILFSESDCEKVISKNEHKAKKLLEDKEEMEKFLTKLEKKLKIVPLVGKQLADLPVMASMVKSYWKKEYTEVPVGTIISILAALIYFVSPVDLILDALPGVGYIDDALIVSICMKMVNLDIEKYKAWRDCEITLEATVDIDLNNEI